MFHSDLAVEALEALTPDVSAEDVTRETSDVRGVRVERVRVLSDGGVRQLGKEKGTYVTLTGASLAHASPDDLEQLCFCTATELSRLVKGKTDRGVLVVGLGNERCTPDALGPRTAAGVLVSRHMQTELARILDDPHLTGVSSLSPGVLGQTGVETGEIVRGVVDRVRPSLVLAVDALAAQDVKRLGRTVQLASVGLAPGSGVGNKRAELSLRSLGVPVISVGVPTVANASAFGARGDGDEETMIVTPREIDLLIDRAAHLLSGAVNRALYPSLDKDELEELAGN